MIPLKKETRKYRKTEKSSKSSFFLEKNYVNFDTEEMTKKKCVIRLCTGLLMVLPVYLFSVDVLRLFANEMAAQWLRTFITAVVAIGLVPLVFKRLEKM